MKRISIHTEDSAVESRRRALGRAFFELRRAERDDEHPKERKAIATTSKPAKRTA